VFPDLANRRERDPDEAERADVLKSWGDLARSAHSVTFHGFGPLPDAGEPRESLSEFVHAEVEDRLRPAVAAIWPAGMQALDPLCEAVDAVASAVGDTIPSLLHHDMHMGNVLVRREEGRYRCVGFIDLESVQAGPPEADIANATVQHDPLFAQEEPHPAFAEYFSEGYGRPPDPLPLGFYETYHLINFGFYSALIGNGEHARLVAEAADESAATVLR
jgi:hypothetical protein